MVTPISGLPLNQVSYGLNDIEAANIRTIQGENFTQQLTQQQSYGIIEEKVKLELNQNIQNNEVDYSKLEEKIRMAVDQSNLTFKFSRDIDTKKMVLKIINTETQEVVQQLPPEIALKISRIVAQFLGSGNLTNAKV